jgi:hypothetical protein
VAAVGWLEIDETDATVAIPGWDRRFSQAAKSRLQQADRSALHDDRRRRAGAADARPSEGPTPQRGRGDRGDTGEVPPPPREAAPWKPESPEETWKAFRAAWNAGAAAGNRREWKPATPPDGWSDRLAEVGWGDKAEEAAKRLGKCRYFETPVTLVQFLGPRFVDLCLGGQYDAAKADCARLDTLAQGGAIATAEADRARAGCLAQGKAVEAAEAIKLVVGAPEAASNRLLVCDLWSNVWRTVDLAPLVAAGCPTCRAADYPWLEGRLGGRPTLLCGRDAVQVPSAARS